MKLFFLLLVLMFSTQVLALHLKEFTPVGEDADTGVDIRLEFSEDIGALGAQEVRPEQIAKVSFTPEVKCKWAYEGTRILKCMPISKLTPGLAYTVKINSGFEGLSVDQRTSSDQVFKFKTSDLAILSYKVNWNNVIVNGEIILNYAIKPDNLSGTIQCDSKNIPVKVKLEKKDKIQVVSFSADPKALVGKNSCTFYFNRPLTLLKFPIQSVPREKVVLTKEVPEVSAGGNYQRNEIFGYCYGTTGYEQRQNINTYLISQLTCEHSDMVQIEIEADEKKLKKFVKVSPAHGVEVSAGYNTINIKKFRPGATYIIAIDKGISPILKSNLVLQLDAVDSPPLLGAKLPYGVLEKDGPLQIPYSALNIKSLELSYGFVSDPKTLLEQQNLSTLEKSDASVTIPLSLEENQNTLFPLEVKPLAKKADFKSGVFVGELKAKEIDPKFIKVQEGLLSADIDKSARTSFKFAFLITDIGLHMKAGQKGVLVWATSLKTGKPLKNVTVTLSGTGVDKEEVTTGKDGLAFFPKVAGGRGRVTAVAKLNDDVSFISTDGFWERGISRYDFNLRNYYDDQESGLVADIVAERPLYLPGETVELKFFVREDAPDELVYKKPGDLVEIQIFNSRDEEIYKGGVTLNKFGTTAIKLQLDPKAATGSYSAIMKIGTASLRFEKAFSVEEFRKPELKVAMDETADAFMGKVSYFSGGELQNGEGQLAVIFKSGRLRPADPVLKRFSYPTEVGGEYYEWSDYYSSESSPEVLSREEIRTNEKGSFSIPKSKILKSVKNYGTLTVEAIFEDSAGGRVAGRISTLVNPYKYIPGIELTSWYYNAGEKVNPRVVALDNKGKPVLGIKMELEVKKITWTYERRLGTGNYFYYDSRREEKLVHKCSFSSNSNFTSCDVPLNDGGSFTFSVKTQGQQNLGPAVASSWVMKDNQFFATQINNHDRINLQVENNDLKLGDKVKLMAMAPFSDGEALVTFERDGILHREQVPVKGNVLIYEKEIKDERLIPGFYASVVMVKGRSSEKIEGEVDLGKPQFKMGYARVQVANRPKRLGVEVLPIAKQIKPGEEMEVTINVKDVKGKGVYSELAIAVVDDSLLSLSGNYQENYDILDTFYNLKKPKVNNYQTLTQLIGRRTYGKKGSGPGGGGGMNLRSDFKNTAYWVAQVETDKNGQHRFKFKVPDNLTTWKVIAVAADESHRFGFGENEFLATKSLTVEPVLPNFLMEGDKFLAQVSVANRSGETQDITVTPFSKTLMIERNEAKLQLKNGGRSSVTFPMRVEGADKADISFQAKAGKLDDGFKLFIPIERQSIVNVSHTNGIVKDEAVSIPLSLPSETRKDSIRLRVESSSTALNGLDEVFRYVLGYPYGCWEQRLSKAYFLVQYEEFKDLITYRFPETEGSISKAVQDLLNLAPDYQTSSGGMRYYPGGEESPDVYLSIFTAHAFNLMKKVGYKINNQVESKLRAYLRTLLVSDSGWQNYWGGEMKSANKALIISVLAEMGEQGLQSTGSILYAGRNGLDLFGLSFLGGYLQSTKGFEQEAKNIFDRLDSLKVVNGDLMHFKEPVKTDDKWKWWSYTDTRSQCAVLQNFVGATENKIKAASLVRTILGRMKNGRWYNTQENIYCFEGLRRFVNKFEKKKVESKLFVKLNGDDVKKDPVIKKNVQTFDLESSELPAELKRIELESSKKEELYYTTTVRYETPFKERAATNNGFELKKQIYLKNDKGYKELTSQTLQLKQGDTLKIVLTVSTPVDRYQVMLNDRLAACFEPINMRLATSSQADSGGVSDVGSEKNKWSSWFNGNGFEYMDLRLNAAQFYSRHMDNGTYSVEYLVQVRSAGEFTLPEAVVEEMYYPDVRGTFGGKKVIVED